MCTPVSFDAEVGVRTATPRLHKRTNACAAKCVAKSVFTTSNKGISESSAKDWRRVNLFRSNVSQGMHLARVAKLADARDLKSRVPNRTYRFDSGPGHHKINHLVNLHCHRILVHKWRGGSSGGSWFAQFLDCFCSVAWSQM